MANSFDVVVIGGGPGGYIAAIRAAQLGFTTACIDDWSTPAGKPAPGGTCTNVGCIPSKALLQSSEHFEHAGHQFAEHGIAINGLGIDVSRMLARKDKVVQQNNDGILFLFKKNKIEFFHGRGSFAGKAGAAWQINVAGKAPQSITGKHVIVATGSSPRPLPGTAFDEKLVLSNTGALAMPEVPKTLGVVGAGVIGLEMGSVWRRLGAEVTILEALPEFLGAADEQIAKEASEGLRQAGPGDPHRDQDQQGDGEERRHRRLHRRRRRGAVGDVRPADRVDRACAEHRGAQRRRRRSRAR